MADLTKHDLAGLLGFDSVADLDAWADGKRAEDVTLAFVGGLWDGVILKGRDVDPDRLPGEMVFTEEPEELTKAGRCVYRRPLFWRLSLEWICHRVILYVEEP